MIDEAILPENPTWSELKRALDIVGFTSHYAARSTTLPGLAGTRSRDIVCKLGESIAAERAEHSRWITGALYTTSEVPGGMPGVYLRQEHGWYAYLSQQEIPDSRACGTLAVDSFRLLAPTTVSKDPHDHG